MPDTKAYSLCCQLWVILWEQVNHSITKHKPSLYASIDKPTVSQIRCWVWEGSVRIAAVPVASSRGVNPPTPANSKLWCHVTEHGAGKTGTHMGSREPGRAPASIPLLLVSTPPGLPGAGSGRGDIRNRGFSCLWELLLPVASTFLYFLSRKISSVHLCHIWPHLQASALKRVSSFRT